MAAALRAKLLPRRLLLLVLHEKPTENDAHSRFASLAYKNSTQKEQIHRKTGGDLLGCFCFGTPSLLFFSPLTDSDKNEK